MKNEKLTKKQLIKVHKDLHESLDKLSACFITQTSQNLSTTTVIDLIHWSYQQTINPSCYKK